MCITYRSVRKPLSNYKDLHMFTHVRCIIISLYSIGSVRMLLSVLPLYISCSFDALTPSTLLPVTLHYLLITSLRTSLATFKLPLHTLSHRFYILITSLHRHTKLFILPSSFTSCCCSSLSPSSSSSSSSFPPPPLSASNIEVAVALDRHLVYKRKETNTDF